MTEEWRDRLAGARMQVDQQFTDQVVQSQFSNQQWGLIMTAVEFEIENADQPEAATMVANTEHLDQILPELDKIEQGMGGAQPGGGQSSGGGIIDSIGKLVPGMGGGDDSGVDEDQLAAATALTEQYATQLQEYLESEGRWADICEGAAASQSRTDQE
jgi:hypothetical protein